MPGTTESERTALPAGGVARPTFCPLPLPRSRSGCSARRGFLRRRHGPLRRDTNTPARPNPTSASPNTTESPSHRSLRSATPGNESSTSLASALSTHSNPKFSYKKGEKIGSGAFGTVYQGLCEQTGSLVAIKETTVALGDKNIPKLIQEIQLMAQLSHPNIVLYLGAKHDEELGVLRIYQEWVPGGSVMLY